MQGGPRPLSFPTATAAKGVKCQHFPDQGEGREKRRASYRWILRPVVSRHHPVETDTRTLNDGKQDTATDGRVPGGLPASTDCECSSSEETGND